MPCQAWDGVGMRNRRWRYLDSLAIWNWLGHIGRVERMWARDGVPEGRMLVSQTLGMGTLPWALGTEAHGHLTWGQVTVKARDYLLFSVNHANTTS